MSGLVLLITGLALFPSLLFAAQPIQQAASLTDHWAGQWCLIVFAVAMVFVILEEFIELRKSKPVVLSAGIIWALIAWSALSQPEASVVHVEEAVRKNLLQYAELMLFMLVVMTYTNALTERQVFDALRDHLRNRGYSYKKLFLLTGMGTFLLSPIMENLVVALMAGAGVVALGSRNRRFVALTCVNIVVAANAGGAFSPFGDITTLMVWQAQIETATGSVDFWSFLNLYPAALVSYLIPTAIMYFAVPHGYLERVKKTTRMRRGAKRVMFLLLASIATAVLFQGTFDLPAVVGMLTGLAYLQFFGFYLKMTHNKIERSSSDTEDMASIVPQESTNPFDIFARIARTEWDTLFFLYGIALSVGGLTYLGYLHISSEFLYPQLGIDNTNILLGLLSSVAGSIPVMYGVLGMMPDMALDQWLLATLSIGIGGSILSIGSATGVALMGQARGYYTFFHHLRWAPAILLGYGCGIWLNLWLS